MVTGSDDPAALDSAFSRHASNPVTCFNLSPAWDKSSLLWARINTLFPPLTLISVILANTMVFPVPVGRTPRKEIPVRETQGGPEGLPRLPFS